MTNKKIEIVLDDISKKECERVFDTIGKIYLEMSNQECRTGKKAVFRAVIPYIPPEEFSSEMIANTWTLLKDLSGMRGSSMRYTIEEKEEEK